MITTEIFFKFAVYEALLWSVADFFLVFYFIGFCNQMRKINKLPQNKFLYYLLFFSVAWVPFILLTKDLTEYLPVELVIINIQYFIIVYLIAKNAKIIRNYFVGLLES